MTALPLQVGLGPPELMIVLLIAVMLFGLPLVAVGVALLYYRRRNGQEEKIAELEREVAELRETVGESPGGADESGRAEGGGEGSPAGSGERSPPDGGA